MKEFFFGIYNWVSAKLFGPSNQEKAFIEMEKLFSIKCQEFERRTQEFEKLRQEGIADRELYRKLSDEYYECEASRTEMANEITGLKIKVFLLEQEVIKVQSDLDRVKNGR